MVALGPGLAMVIASGPPAFFTVTAMEALPSTVAETGLRAPAGTPPIASETVVETGLPQASSA